MSQVVQSSKYSGLIVVPRGFSPDKPRARDILGCGPREAKMVCTRCRRVFKTEKPALACPECKAELLAEAKDAEGKRAGNMPRDLDVVTEAVKPASGTTVRPRFMGESEL